MTGDGIRQAGHGTGPAADREDRGSAGAGPGSADAGTADVVTMAAAPWEAAIPEHDREVMRRAMGTRAAPLGRRPALLVIDVLYGFTGTAPMPVLEAIEEYPTSCGSVAWETLPAISAVIAAFRAASLPILWTCGDDGTAARFGSATKRRAAAPAPAGRPGPNEIHASVAPAPEETVVIKARASAFFGTPLALYLQLLRADSVVLTGSTTSGCVRASAVDSFSWGRPTFVVHDGCFDRSRISHDVALFDLASKYATVLNAAELIRELKRRDR